MGGRVWQDPEKDKLVRFIEQNMGSDDLIPRLAKRLGRSEAACRLKARALGYRLTPNGQAYMTVAQVGALLSRAPASVRGWVDKGHMAGVAKPHKRRAIYAIRPEDLWAWMENKASWHLWEPEGITDPVWREHFTEVRRGWLRPAEIAERLSYHRHSLPWLYRKLGLNVHKTARWALWIHEDELRKAMGG